MSEARPQAAVDRIAAHVRTVCCGDDTRLRATWRVLLAWPVLWILTGDVLTANLAPLLPALPGGSPTTGMAVSVLHAAFFLAALLAWARLVDRLPLSSYGVAASVGWLGRALLGLVAVLGGMAAWIGLGTVLGDVTVATSLSAPQGPLPAFLLVMIVALGLHAAIQQVVFFRVILGNAAEGLASRGVDPARALLLAVGVAIPFFVAMHSFPGGLRAVDLAIAGAVFGLVYLHTSDLAVGIGMHFGALYGGGVVFSSATSAANGATIFAVEGRMPGLLGTLGQYGFPKLLVAYVLVLGWLTWQRGVVSFDRDILSPAAGD